MTWPISHNLKDSKKHCEIFAMLFTMIFTRSSNYLLDFN